MSLLAVTNNLANDLTKLLLVEQVVKVESGWIPTDEADLDPGGLIALTSGQSEGANRK